VRHYPKYGFSCSDSGPDYARSHPLSEAAVIGFISSFTILQGILSILLEPLDAMILSSPPLSDAVFNGVRSSAAAAARACGFGIVLGFTGLLLPFYRELERRTSAADAAVGNQYSHARLLILRNQTHEMVVLSAGLFGKGVGYLPPMVHQAHTYWAALAAWAEFCLDDADVSIVHSTQHLKVLEEYASSPFSTVVESTLNLYLRIAAKLNEVGYSLDLSPYAGLIHRLESYISAYRIPALDRSLQGSDLYSWRGEFQHLS
jgi:hypothetical protein